MWERSIPNGTTVREYSKWNSPELANSDAFRRMPVDHYRDTYRGEYRPDSDIYAFACTIIEIYTGQTPGTYRINGVQDSLRGSGFMPDTVNIAAIPQDITQTLTLMMHLDPGRRLNSGLVVQHLMSPKLVHVTNFQPALAKYQARRFMRRANTVHDSDHTHTDASTIDNGTYRPGAMDFPWSRSLLTGSGAPVVENDADDTDAVPYCIIQHRRHWQLEAFHGIPTARSLVRRPRNMVLHTGIYRCVIHHHQMTRSVDSDFWALTRLADPQNGF